MLVYPGCRRSVYPGRYCAGTIPHPMVYRPCSLLPVHGSQALSSLSLFVPVSLRERPGPQVQPFPGSRVGLIPQVGVLRPFARCLLPGPGTLLKVSKLLKETSWDPPKMSKTVKRLLPGTSKSVKTVKRLFPGTLRTVLKLLKDTSQGPPLELSKLLKPPLRTLQNCQNC